MIESAPGKFTLYPLLWLAICLTCGIVAADFPAFDWKIYFAACLVFFFLAVVSLKRKFVFLFIFAAFFSVGGLFLQIEKQTIAETRIKKLYDGGRINSGEPVEIEGVLTTKPELAVGGFFLSLEAKRVVYKNAEIAVSGKVRLFASVPNDQIGVEYQNLNLNYGARIRLACNLRRENDFQNAGAMPLTTILDQKQIDATATIKSPLLVEKLADEKSFAPLGWIYTRRQNLIVDFRDTFSRSTAGVLIASLLGNEHFLDRETAEVFRRGGTFHVLVISGLHITFIGGLTLLFVRFFTNKRLAQFVIATAFLWAYSIAVGADVPVVRATVMFTILLFSQVVYRSGTLLNALGCCALILLVWRPSDVFTSSFQLTFVSVAAIVAVGFPLIERLRAIGGWSPSAAQPFPPRVPIWLKRFCERLYWREDIWERDAARQIWKANLFKTPHLKLFRAGTWQIAAAYFFEAILISLIFQICLLPLLAIYFHRFPVLSVFLNLWVGIVIALESFAAVFAVFLSYISDVLALPVVKLTEVLNWLLVRVPGFFAEASWTNRRLPVYSGAMRAVYFLYFAPLIFLIVALNLWNPFALKKSSKLKFSSLKPAAACLILFFALIVFHPFSQPSADGRLRVDFLDVGQGDAALIRFPNGETMLVDGGGRPNFNRINMGTEDAPEIFEPDTRTVGEAVVSEFLWERGYSKIDYILATHADADHIQGLSDVAKNFRVRAALFGRTLWNDAEFARLISVLQNEEIESFFVSASDELTFDSVKIEILNPPPSHGAEAISDNNNSLVLRVSYGNRKILLTGDIEKEAERELLNQPGFLRADVVKVAHHGSRTSSIETFVSAVAAQIAVVSVGKDSPYGHPHGEVVERWKNSGAKILTTGENGTVSVSTDGRDLRLETFGRETIYR